MKSFWVQLSQWPPTSSTVIGLGVLAGLLSYMATGDLRVAIGIAGAFKVICPERAADIDRALVLDEKIIPHQGRVS